ncbi:hypothetical protein GALMADRAFT_148578 [Galerina marginata CBS 339.88]|uniref:Uncharacterized protein n=1 Tax=Galerina marginata (strain CBS 339.88) TaxID=685588 RepID=A0A067SCW8_GALM3|nr:hypothetical protein GALMADRAFT_148578 [Galerina marginata CBS 339.88]
MLLPSVFTTNAFACVVSVFLYWNYRFFYRAGQSLVCGLKRRNLYPSSSSVNKMDKLQAIPSHGDIAPRGTSISDHDDYPTFSDREISLTKIVMDNTHPPPQALLKSVPHPTPKSKPGKRKRLKRLLRVVLEKSLFEEEVKAIAELIGVASTVDDVSASVLALGRLKFPTKMVVQLISDILGLQPNRHLAARSVSHHKPWPTSTNRSTQRMTQVRRSESHSASGSGTEATEGKYTHPSSQDSSLSPATQLQQQATYIIAGSTGLQYDKISGPDISTVEARESGDDGIDQTGMQHPLVSTSPLGDENNQTTNSNRNKDRASQEIGESFELTQASSSQKPLGHASGTEGETVLLPGTQFVGSDLELDSTIPSQRQDDRENVELKIGPISSRGEYEVMENEVTENESFGHALSYVSTVTNQGQVIDSRPDTTAVRSDKSRRSMSTEQESTGGSASYMRQLGVPKGNNESRYPRDFDVGQNSRWVSEENDKSKDPSNLYQKFDTNALQSKLTPVLRDRDADSQSPKNGPALNDRLSPMSYHWDQRPLPGDKKDHIMKWTTSSANFKIDHPEIPGEIGHIHIHHDTSTDYVQVWMMENDSWSDISQKYPYGSTDELLAVRHPIFTDLLLSKRGKFNAPTFIKHLIAKDRKPRNPPEPAELRRSQRGNMKAPRTASL